MTGKDLLDSLKGPRGKALLESLYGPDEAAHERRRYVSLLDGMSPQAGFPADFTGGEPRPTNRGFEASAEGSAADGNLRIFSAPGRTELGGNHTDHNRGRVLAAAIQMDAVAAVVPCSDRKVFFRSTGFPDVLVNLDDNDGRPDLSPKPEEAGTTEALVRGIASQFASRGM